MEQKEQDINAIINLEALQNKLTQLSHSLRDFLQSPDDLRWPAVLSQFNILIAQYETLLGEMRLRGDWLKKQLVVPSSVFAERPELIPDILLRTKLEPAIEELEAETLRNATHARGTASDEINYLDETAVKKALQAWESRMQVHDEVVHSAMEHVNDNRTLRKALKKRLPPAKDEDAFVEQAGKENKRELERMLRWMSSGPYIWAESEKRRASISNPAPPSV